MCQIRKVISIFVPFKGNKRILNGLFYPILRLNSPSEIERVCSGICNGVEYRCLIFETCQWDNLHTIRTSVCHASSRQDDKQVWFTQRHLLLCFVMLLYKSFYLQEVSSTIIYLPTAKLVISNQIAKRF